MTINFNSWIINNSTSCRNSSPCARFMTIKVFKLLSTNRINGLHFCFVHGFSNNHSNSLGLNNGFIKNSCHVIYCPHNLTLQKQNTLPWVHEWHDNNECNEEKYKVKDSCLKEVTSENVNCPMVPSWFGICFSIFL